MIHKRTQGKERKDRWLIRVTKLTGRCEFLFPSLAFLEVTYIFWENCALLKSKITSHNGVSLVSSWWPKAWHSGLRKGLLCFLFQKSHRILMAGERWTFLLYQVWVGRQKGPGEGCSPGAILPVAHFLPSPFGDVTVLWTHQGCHSPRGSSQTNTKASSLIP